MLVVGEFSHVHMPWVESRVEWPKWPQTPFYMFQAFVCFHWNFPNTACNRFVVLKLKQKKKKEQQILLPIILHSTVCVGGAAGAESSSLGIKANHLIERSEISPGFK